MPVRRRRDQHHRLRLRPVQPDDQPWPDGLLDEHESVHISHGHLGHVRVGLGAPRTGSDLSLHVQQCRDVPVSLHAPSIAHDGHDPGRGRGTTASTATSPSAATSTATSPSAAASPSAASTSSCGGEVPRAARDRTLPRPGEDEDQASEVQPRSHHQAAGPSRPRDRPEPAAWRDQAPWLPGQARRRAPLGAGPGHRGGRERRGH